MYYSKHLDNFKTFSLWLYRTFHGFLPFCVGNDSAKVCVCVRMGGCVQNLSAYSQSSQRKQIKNYKGFSLFLLRFPQNSVPFFVCEGSAGVSLRMGVCMCVFFMCKI